MDGHPWIPNSPGKIREDMLRSIGVEDLEEFFRDIPREARVGDWDGLGVGMGEPVGEIEAWMHIDRLLGRNRVFKNPPPFLGAGVWPHYVPALVDYIVSRAEILTTYTPYQGEITAGLMQILFEYQSLMADLLEMDVVNASMYDWGTAAAEAFLMAARVRRDGDKILVPATMNPWHRRIAETYLAPKNIRVIEYGYDPETGLADLDDIAAKLEMGGVAAVYVENPGFLGFIEENAAAIGEMAHEKNALYIIGVEPTSLGLLKPPGRLGADIAVGEGQPLGLPMNYGGPLLGIFAARMDRRLIRQMPGRIIGLTRTAREGEKGFSMILQTREQHIRREKATSNICTNEALCAVAAAVYMALLGPRGIRELAELIYYRSHYAAARLREIGVRAPLLRSEFYMEFTAGFPEKPGYATVHRRLLEKGIHGGLYLRPLYPWLGEAALFCVTELHTADHIDMLVDAVRDILEGR